MAAKPKAKEIVVRLSFAEDDPMFSKLATFTSDKTLKYHLYHLIRRGDEAILQAMVIPTVASSVMPANQVPFSSGSIPANASETASVSVNDTPAQTGPDLTDAIGKIDTSALDWLDRGEWPQTQQ
jgi:hypothetical protein